MAVMTYALKRYSLTLGISSLKSILLLLLVNDKTMVKEKDYNFVAKITNFIT
jgi:hypothetical protein